ncbi:Uncharacterised protein [uncultured archaeon]|nr:Uncharacterised protein [uncultured archaeon]
MESRAYPSLNRAWNSSCRLLFGQELGELRDFEPWLARYLAPATTAKSFISGKPATLTTPYYSENGRFASFDEVDFAKKFEPLSINDIKDIDSIVDALGERLFYAGNIVLGVSSNVESSSNVIDSHFVRGSNVVSDSKYIGFSSETRYSENCFGCYVIVESAYSMKSGGGRNSRTFECHHCQFISDSYY